MKYFTMPDEIVMLFAYFMGVFASVQKIHWYYWLLPLIPLFSLYLLEKLYRYKPKQRIIKDFE